MIHPSNASLALLAGGDLGFFETLRVSRHVKSCARCQREVEAFQASSQILAEEVSELPEGFRWDRLAAEMNANIRVGLEAAECVARPRNTARVDWRAAAVMAAMSLVLLGAWYLNPLPHSLDHAMRARRPEIRSTNAGLELNENGNALVLLHGSGGQPQRAMIVSAPGSLRARYVDADTGQITIHNVYSE
jgi:hypothetical protein